MKKALLTIILSLSLIVVLVPFSASSISAAIGYHSTGYTTHYQVDTSIDNSGAVVTWAPQQRYDAYVDIAAVQLRYNNSGSYTYETYYFSCFNSGDARITLTSTKAGQVDRITVSTSGTYTVTSTELSTLSTISSYCNDINDNVQAMLDKENSIWSDVNHIRLVLDDLFSLIKNGIALKNYDISLLNVSAISYFAAAGGSIVTNQNAFTNSNIIFFDYPIMLGYQNTDPTTSNSLYMYPDKEYVFILIWNRTSAIFNQNNFSFDVMSGYDTPVVKRNYQNTLASTCIVNALFLDPVENYSRFTIDWSTSFVNYLNNYQYIPLYFGPVDMCPDDYLALINRGFSAEEQSEQVSHDMDNINDDFNSTVSDLDDLESDLTSDFETNIQAIDTTFNITDVSDDLYYSAQFVRQQFDNLTTGTPFGTILLFSMTLGLALLIIGRKL